MDSFLCLDSLNVYMEIVFHADGTTIRKEVTMMDEKDIYSKDLSYRELEKKQPDITVRSIDVERFDDGSLKTIMLSDSDKSGSSIGNQDFESPSQEFIECVAQAFGLKKGTVTYDNVTGVISRIKEKGKVNKTTWNQAVKERTREAIKEKPSRDEDSYHFTVRSQCVREQGYDKDEGGVRAFLDDVEDIILKCSDNE